MDASRAAGLVPTLAVPGTVAGLLNAIASLLDGTGGVSVNVHVDGDAMAVVVARESTITRDEPLVDAWVPISGKAGDENPFSNVKIRARALSGGCAATAGITSVLVSRTGDRTRGEQDARIHRACFHTWAPGNSLLETILDGTPPGTGFVICEPTGMVPCPVQKGHGMMRVTIQSDDGSPANVEPCIVVLRETLEPRHPIYPLKGIPLLSAKFLTGATSIEVYPGERDGTIDLWYSCPPLDSSSPGNIGRAVHRAVTASMPDAVVGVDILDTEPGSVSPPGSWLLDRLESWFVAETGEHPYLDWHVSPSVAPVIARTCPGAPWVVLGPGTGGKGGKVSMEDVERFAGVLDHLATRGGNVS